MHKNRYINWLWVICISTFDFISLIFSNLFLVKLNGGRHVIGVLRGFDPFMNLVLDEAVEQLKDERSNKIGMVVSILYVCQFIK